MRVSAYLGNYLKSYRTITINMLNKETNNIVNLKTCSEIEKSGRFSPSRIFFIFLLFVFSSGVFVEASVGANVTFSWQANPPEDYVIGYRLHYGAASRFNSNGTPKASFSYDYYIDFSDLKR